MPHAGQSESYFAHRSVAANPNTSSKIRNMNPSFCVFQAPPTLSAFSIRNAVKLAVINSKTDIKTDRRAAAGRDNVSIAIAYPAGLDAYRWEEQSNQPLKTHSHRGRRGSGTPQTRHMHLMCATPGNKDSNAAHDVPHNATEAE